VASKKEQNFEELRKRASERISELLKEDRPVDPLVVRDFAKYYEEKIKELEYLEKKQYLDLRKKFAWATFALLVLWLAVILVIVFLQGYSCITLSDAVLITLISTTTANIAAYFLVVIRHLFPLPKGAKLK